MGQIELIIALVVFVATTAGAVLYLRADVRANRQEWKSELTEFRSEVSAVLNKMSADIEGLAQRVTSPEAKVEALDTKIDTKVAELSAQMQRNHRELLIRLAFHHHGDGRYPV